MESDPEDPAQGPGDLSDASAAGLQFTLPFREREAVLATHSLFSQGC